MFSHEGEKHLCTRKFKLVATSARDGDIQATSSLQKKVHFLWHKRWFKIRRKIWSTRAGFESHWLPGFYTPLSGRTWSEILRSLNSLNFKFLNSRVLLLKVFSKQRKEMGHHWAYKVKYILFSYRFLFSPIFFHTGKQLNLIF